MHDQSLAIIDDDLFLEVLERHRAELLVRNENQVA